MNVSQSSESLVSIELNQNHWHLLLHFVVMLQDSKHSFRNVIHDDVQVDLVRFVSLGVESMLQSYYIWVIELLHYLEFPVFVSLVLIHFFNGYLL